MPSATPQAMDQVTEPSGAAPVEADGGAMVSALAGLERGTSRIPAALRGEWRVVRQTVAGDGIQAYGDDEPELIGKTLVMGADTAGWRMDTPPLEGRCKDAWFDGSGPAPADLASALTRLGVSAKGAKSASFICMGADSNWGPQGELLDLIVLPDGRIAIGYTDNLILLLARNR